MSGIDALRELVPPREGLALWLARTIADTGDASAFDDEAFLIAFSSAGRHLGKEPIALTESEVAALVSKGVDWSIAGWGADELGRVLALGDVVSRLGGDRGAALVEACYARGDNRERQAVLRALPFLDEPQRFVPLAVDACRTSVQTVFDAIACENPFPAREFPDLNLNQMVLKSLFNGVALARIVGLAGRAGPELARMAADYAAERRAAGRTVPSDIDLVLQPRAGGTT
jgi:hypothetical protein